MPSGMRPRFPEGVKTTSEPSASVTAWRRHLLRSAGAIPAPAGIHPAPAGAISIRAPAGATPGAGPWRRLLPATLAVAPDPRGGVRVGAHEHIRGHHGLSHLLVQGDS